MYDNLNYKFLKRLCVHIAFPQNLKLKNLPTTQELVTIILYYQHS